MKKRKKKNKELKLLLKIKKKLNKKRNNNRKMLPKTKKKKNNKNNSKKIKKPNLLKNLKTLLTPYISNKIWILESEKSLKSGNILNLINYGAKKLMLEKPSPDKLPLDYKKLFPSKE